ncbi:MAG TPA: MBL fold metallo-hydrolase [Ignavibacteriaceae bacterium]|nr:MBL fold metallo-hydrolase [Ignavibacteriaceae bacterium]
MKSIILSNIIICLLIMSSDIYSQKYRLTDREESALITAFEEDSLFADWVENLPDAVKLYEQYKADLLSSDSIWNSNQRKLQKIKDFGCTTKFEFVPLVESLDGNNQFKKAIGVSYLIHTDSSTILFDTGWDEDSEICVFRYNLDKLGENINDINNVVISHNHGDHQNEWKWVTDKSFTNSDNRSLLSGIKIYVPEDTLNLPVKTIYSREPVKISEGVYTTGIIRAPMFFGPAQEQSLIFNVKDKGIIIVTGCGHHTVEKLLLRCGKLTDIPAYGILGGLHFPLEGESKKYMSYFITGKLPWEKFTLADVNKKIELIKKRNLKLIGVSTHDSSVGAIKAFRTAFSKEYKDLIPGEWILVE